MPTSSRVRLYAGSGGACAKSNCHCEGAKRLRQSVSRLPARSALLPSAEVSTGHPRPPKGKPIYPSGNAYTKNEPSLRGALATKQSVFPVLVRTIFRGETDCFAYARNDSGLFCSFVSGFACVIFTFSRAVMPAPTIPPEMHTVRRRGGSHPPAIHDIAQ